MPRTLAKRAAAKKKKADSFARINRRLAQLEKAIAAPVIMGTVTGRLDPLTSSPDERAAHSLGAQFAHAFINDDHPRVMDGEAPLQPLRNLRNKVRRENGGQFNGAAERPLYRAFLGGICAVVGVDK